MNLRKQNIKNLNTEKEGIVILRTLVDGFMVPDKEHRLYLYNILDVDYKKYSRSIDGVIIHVPTFEEIKSKIKLVMNGQIFLMVPMLALHRF